jgi:hypothetical protein
MRFLEKGRVIARHCVNVHPSGYESIPAEGPIVGKQSRDLLLGP